MAILSSYFVAIFALCVLSDASSKTCTLEDGSDHECPVFDDETKVQMFTAEELSQYDGVKNSKIYLAVIGEVFDVTKGKNYYGPDAGSYSGFAAKDGSRAFALGGFTDKELISDITDLEPAQVISVYDWATFYRKDYTAVGKLIGMYYDKDGNPTEHRKQVQQLILKGYLASKQQQDMSKKYPRCNSQSGTRVRNRVWCSAKSGGVERGWDGVPRKFLDPTLGGAKGRTRCACVPLEEASDTTRFQLYDEYPCDETATECFLEPPLKTEKLLSRIMTSAVDKIDNLLNIIDTDESKEQCSVLGLGNPLLDISSPVNADFMKKYGIKPGNAILAEDKHIPMYQELADMETVEYIGGGSTLNSVRVCQWMLQQKQSVGYMGCIGTDKFGQVLESTTKEAGVECYFMKDDTTPTGTCAVCITDKERSLVANLAAANNFKIDHCKKDRAKQLISAAKVIYTAGFFITVSVDTMLMLGAECQKVDKPYCLNLSAEFITTVFKEQLLKVLPYVQIVFSNEDESKSFAKANAIEYSDMKDLAVKISKLEPSLTKKARTVVITQGCDPVIVATGDKVAQYPVKKIEKEKIVDLNGAGDAFVGGFLSQFVKGNDESVCVAAGTYCAQYMIQRAGTKLEGKPAFEEKMLK